MLIEFNLILCYLVKTWLGDFANTHGLKPGDYIILYQTAESEKYVSTCVMELYEFWKFSFLTFLFMILVDIY